MVPPVAESVAEYATLTVPVGMEVVLITSGEAWTVSVLAAVMPLSAAEITVALAGVTPICARGPTTVTFTTADVPTLPRVSPARAVRA